MMNMEKEFMNLEAVAEEVAEAVEENEEVSTDANDGADENFLQDSLPMATHSFRAYLGAMASNPRLTPEEEIELGKLKDAGDTEARETLIKCNMKLAVKLAKEKYTALNECSGLCITFEDLVQEATLGLITAVDKFDWTRNCKFSTNAVYWIKSALTDYVCKSSRMIRLPSYKINQLTLINRAINALRDVLNREPTEVEIAAYLNFQFTPKEITDSLSAVRNTSAISLSTPIDSDGRDESTVEDFVADNSNTPQQSTTALWEREQLHQAVEALPQRERLIINHSYGFGEAQELTLDEIAAVLYQHGFKNRDGKPFTKEGIRQIREQALKSMRIYIAKQGGIN